MGRRARHDRRGDEEIVTQGVSFSEDANYRVA
jgi:hypothetical protein